MMPAIRRDLAFGPQYLLRFHLLRLRPYRIWQRALPTAPRPNYLAKASEEVERLLGALRLRLAVRVDINTGARSLRKR
jgi:hypothetical protein